MLLLLLLGTVGALYEFRSAWIATVENIDWPSSPNLSVAEQQQELLSILDSHQTNNLNAVIFQVRPSCDAFYQSSLEPWSEWLTGKQGVAPSPLYDPLALVVKEAHARGMEVHAWMNPYRAVVDITQSSVSPQHISNTHPQWIVTYGTEKVLNPGLTDVWSYVNKVVTEIITNYQVDAIHWDDYFYPYPIDNVTFDDAATFAKYPRGFTNLSEWRRDNVNQLVKQTYATIRSVANQTKRIIKFGLSPFGIYKNGVPAGISGFSSYDEIYCDPLAWLSSHSVDYLVPQLYWPIGGAQDYNKLLAWWAEQVAVAQRHLYPGLAAYRLPDAGWTLDTVLDQITANRQFNATSPAAIVLGEVFFSSKSVTDNLKGIQDALRSSVYNTPATVPPMPWLA